MTAPVCPSLPQYRPSLPVGEEVRTLGARQSPQCTSTTGTLVGGSLLPVLTKTAAPVSAPVSLRSTTQQTKALFSGRWVAWTEKGAVRIPEPAWLNWPSHTAAEMGPPIRTPAELAAQSKAKRR